MLKANMPTLKRARANPDRPVTPANQEAIADMISKEGAALVASRLGIGLHTVRRAARGDTLKPSSLRAIELGLAALRDPQRAA